MDTLAAWPRPSTARARGRTAYSHILACTQVENAQYNDARSIAHQGNGSRKNRLPRGHRWRCTPNVWPTSSHVQPMFPTCGRNHNTCGRTDSDLVENKPKPNNLRSTLVDIGMILAGFGPSWPGWVSPPSSQLRLAPPARACDYMPPNLALLLATTLWSNLNAACGGNLVHDGAQSCKGQPRLASSEDPRAYPSWWRLEPNLDHTNTITTFRV